MDSMKKGTASSAVPFLMLKIIEVRLGCYCCVLVIIIVQFGVHIVDHANGQKVTDVNADPIHTFSVSSFNCSGKISHYKRCKIYLKYYGIRGKCLHQTVWTAFPAIILPSRLAALSILTIGTKRVGTLYMVFTPSYNFYPFCTVSYLILWLITRTKRR